MSNPVRDPAVAAILEAISPRQVGVYRKITVLFTPRPFLFISLLLYDEEMARTGT